MTGLLVYNDALTDHRFIADCLADLRVRIELGLITQATPNAKYHGHEIEKAYSKKWAKFTYLKADAGGKSTKRSLRGSHRIIVRIFGPGKPSSKTAFFWRHDKRIVMLSKGFFRRAKSEEVVLRRQILRTK